MIKGVFLDLGWTLFWPASGDWFIIPKMLEFTSLEKIKALPTGKRKAAFGKAFQYMDDHHLLWTAEEEVGQFRTFYAMIAAELPELGITAGQAKEIAEAKVFDMSHYLFFERYKETLIQLKAKYKLGIISDTWPSSDRILRGGGVDDVFDCKTYSCHLGAWKPNPKMYRDALGQMGLPPEETVFVDDWEPNLDGAAACGINPILIKTRRDPLVPDQQFAEDTLDSGKYPGIHTIGELPGLLEDEVFQ